MPPAPVLQLTALWLLVLAALLADLDRSAVAAWTALSRRRLDPDACPLCGFPYDDAGACPCWELRDWP